jgi:hypothetical protein
MLEESLQLTGQRGKYELFDVELDTAAALCAALTVDDLRPIISIAHGTLQYPSAPELQQIRDAYLNTTTNASQKYREKRRESLLAISVVL